MFPGCGRARPFWQVIAVTAIGGLAWGEIILLLLWNESSRHGWHLAILVPAAAAWIVLYWRMVNGYRASRG